MKPIRWKHRITTPVAAIAALVLCALPAAAATTVTLVPVADTYADEDNQNSNYSASGELRVGLSFEFLTRRRGYIRFDISKLPSNAIVSGATLRLHLGGGSGPTVTIGLYQVNGAWTPRT